MTGPDPGGPEDVKAAFDLIADSIESIAERADYALTGGQPATWLLHRVIDANQQLAAAVRGQEPAP